jgi:hypothetical protein
LETQEVVPQNAVPILADGVGSAAYPKLTPINVALAPDVVGPFGPRVLVAMGQSQLKAVDIHPTAPAIVSTTAWAMPTPGAGVRTTEVVETHL